MPKLKPNNKHSINSSSIKKIAAEIIAMANEDIQMRRQYNKTGEWQTRTDKRNTKSMKQIVSEYGWPTVSLVGKKANLLAWLLIQHADLDPHFQAHCLNLMKKTARENPKDVDKSSIAYLTDRVKVNLGLKQLFGTQFYVKDGEIIPRPIWDLKNLKKRRANFNLEPFEKNKQRMVNNYRRHQKNTTKSLKSKKGAITRPFLRISIHKQVN